MHRMRIVAALFLAISFSLAQGHAQQSGPIVKLDPALDAIVPAGAQLEKLRDGFVFLEGPVWVRKGGYLLFSNMPEHAVDKWSRDGKISVYLDLTKFKKDVGPTDYLSSGTTLDPQGRLVYCSQTERAIMRIEKNGERTVLADHYEGTQMNSPNDLVYKANGSLYFTAPARPPLAKLPSSVYLLKDGKLQLITIQLSSPNGIALSPNGKILYVNDISKKTVWAYDVQPDDMALNPRVFLDMNSDSTVGGPDGMKVDKKGNVYDSGPGGIWIVSPEGKHLGTILTPDRVSNLAFGDPDGKSLFITMHNELARIRPKNEGVRP